MRRGIADCSHGHFFTATDDHTAIRWGAKGLPRLIKRINETPPPPQPSALLAQNIDINARYRNDLTLLMWAAGPDENVLEVHAVKVVEYLLDAGAHVDDRDDRGRTALMIAAEGGHADIAALLLARGADPSLKDKAGKRAADLTVLSSLRERLAVP